MIPILFSPTATQFNTFGIGHLTDAVSPHVVEERNGEFYLEMQYPVGGEHYEDIGMRSIILAKPSPDQDAQPFRVYKITKPINGIVSIFAYHIRYDLGGVPVAPFTATSLSDALSKMVSKRLITSPFTFTTDKTSGLDMASNVPSSTLALMGGQAGSLLDTYGGEFKFDKFNVALLEARGTNRGVVIRYGVDLIDLQQEENCSSCYTGVLCFWQATEGDEVVSGTIQSAGTFNYSRILVVDRSDKYETAPTQEQLNNDAISYINANNVGVPKVSLNVSFANLEQTEEYKNIRQSIRLCDYVTVKFEKLGVSASAKVIMTDYDVINERYISVSIGDSRTSLADTIVGMASTLQDVPTTTEMAQAINVMTEAITGANGGAVRLLDTNNDGMPDTLYIADNADPTLASKVWRFNYQGWGASRNGYNGPFTMGATFAQGFLAEFITAGILSADRIGANSISVSKLTGTIGNSGWVIDLENGTLTIGNISASNITSGTINADNINVTNINGQNIKAGTVGSTPIASGAVISDKLASGSVIAEKLGASSVVAEKISSGAVTNSKLGESSVSETKIGTDAVVNRCIASASIYPTTCNSTINGYFADVIEFNALRAGSLVVDYLQAGVVGWDHFKFANDGYRYTMYIDYSTGALYAHRA